MENNETNNNVKLDNKISKNNNKKGIEILSG